MKESWPEEHFGGERILHVGCVRDERGHRDWGGGIFGFGVFYVRPGAVWYEVRVCLSMGFHKVYIVARSVWQYFGGMSVFEN